MKKIVGILALAAAAGSAMAQGGTSQATATNWNGPQTVTGAFSAAVLGQEQLVYFQDNITPVSGADAVFSTTVNGLIGGTAFRAQTGPAGSGAGYDTRLRVRNSSLTVLGDNDDASGLGLYSRVTGTVPGDGSLLLDTTYWTNSSYNDAATVPGGGYSLSLFSVSYLATGVSTQWYRFTGLGGMLEAEVMSATGVTDTVMAAFDSSGTLLFSNDDGGVGLLSAITAGDNVAIPNDGVMYLAVTYYRGGSQTDPAFYANQDGFNGSGDFTLRVVPTPGAMALIGLAGLAGLRRRR